MRWSRSSRRAPSSWCRRRGGGRRLRRQRGRGRRRRRCGRRRCLGGRRRRSVAASAEVRSWSVVVGGGAGGVYSPIAIAVASSTTPARRQAALALVRDHGGVGVGPEHAVGAAAQEDAGVDHRPLDGHDRRPTGALGDGGPTGRRRCCRATRPQAHRGRRRGVHDAGRGEPAPLLIGDHRAPRVGAEHAVGAATQEDAGVHHRPLDGDDRRPASALGDVGPRRRRGRERLDRAGGHHAQGRCRRRIDPGR